MIRLLLASRNAHKTREFSEILGSDFVVRDLSGDSEAPAVKETGSSFAENASLKAVAISKWSGGLVVADDSGLEVDALNGAPGIYSARYAGPAATDQQNITRLLGELRRCSSKSPFSARFRCVLALTRAGKLLGTFEGAVAGTLVDAPRGDSGFGYDPVFQPLGLTKTFAELDPTRKNEISHRAQAVRLLRAALARQPAT
jgi:XTP/dITP diphosphohydrolase